MLKSYESNRLKIGDLLSVYCDCSFVNREGKVINANELSFIGAGCNSSVWKYISADTPSALKIFFDDTRHWSLKYDCYEIMKDLPLERTLKGKDSFYQDDNTLITYEKIDAYIMDYINSRNNNSLLDMPTSIFLENIQLLEKDVEILAENRINTEDVKIENSIISQSYELFFSDTDLYNINYSCSKDIILKRNKTDIVWFILSYMKMELGSLGDFTRNEYWDKFDEIYDILYFKLSKEAIHESLERVFSQYECPKEYFLSKKK